MAPSDRETMPPARPASPPPSPTKPPPPTGAGNATGAGETPIDLYRFLELRFNSTDDEYEQRAAEEIWTTIETATPAPIAAEQRNTTSWEVVSASQDRSLETPRAIAGVRVYYVRNPGEETHYILKHPTRQQMMKLSPDAYFLWQRFDGETSVRELIFAYLQRYGAVAPEKVLDVIDQANVRGFLRPPGVDVYKQVGHHVAAQHVRWALRLREFYNRKWTIPGFEACVGAIVKFGGFIAFNKWVLILLFLPLIMYGMSRWIQEIGVQKYNLLTTNGSFLLGIATYFLIKIGIGIVHEFSQAMYLKSLGREVPEGGVIWYYGLPYAFHNSNDIWLEPKRRRLLHSGVGLGAELVIGSLAYVALQVLAYNGVPETSLASNIAYKVGMLAFFGAFFKLNPLIELDGYFMLVDISQIPRLMRRSFYFLQWEIWGKLFRRESFTYREKIYILYGLIAILWMIVFYALLVIIGQKHVVPIWDELTANIDFLGLLLYAVVLIVLLAPAVTSAWSYLWVWREQIRENVLKFLVYSSQKLVMSSLIGAAFAVPLVLQVIPFFTLSIADTDRKDVVYLTTMRGLTALGCAIAAGLLMLPYFRKRWIDQRTRRFFGCLAWAGIFFAAAQLMYMWVLTLAKHSRDATDLIGAGFELLASICLIPGVYHLIGQVRSFPRLPRLFRSFLTWQEIASLLLGLCVFFLLGELALRHDLRAMSDGGREVLRPTFIFLAAIRALNIAVIAFVLIPLWLFVLSTVLSKSFFPWLGIAVSLSAFALSIVFHALDDASVFAGGLTRQHFAMNTSAALMMLCSVAMMLAFRYQMRFKVYGNEDSPAMGETELLRKVLSKLVWSLLKNVEDHFGRPRRDAMRLKFEQRIGVGVKIAVGELTDDHSRNLALNRLGRRSRAIFQRVTNVFIEEFGWTLYRRALVNIHDGLYWEERELAHRHIFREENWGVTLVHYESADLTTDRKREIFRRIPLFSDFGEDELLALMARFREESFSTGSLVFRQGDESDKLYVVLAGRVVVESRFSGKNPDEPPLAELRRGDYFGELSLVKEATRTATVRCVEPTTMLSLDKQTYQALADRYRAIGRKIEEAFQFLDLLEEITVFRELSPQRVREVATCMRLRRLDPGEFAVRQGEPGQKFHIIRHGTMRLVRNLGSPDEWHEGDIGRGSYFGEVALLEDMPSHATAIATSEVELLELDRDDFERLLGKYVALAPPTARTLTRRATEMRKRPTQRSETRINRFRMVDRTTRRSLESVSDSAHLVPLSSSNPD